MHVSFLAPLEDEFRSDVLPRSGTVFPRPSFLITTFMSTQYSETSGWTRCFGNQSVLKSCSCKTITNRRKILSVPGTPISAVLQYSENLTKDSEKVAQIFQAHRLVRLFKCQPKLPEHINTAFFNCLKNFGFPKIHCDLATTLLEN